MGASKGHITLEMKCGMRLDSKAIEVNYLIVDVLSPYNVIICRLTINSLGEIIFIQYLVMKYPLLIG